MYKLTRNFLQEVLYEDGKVIVSEQGRALKSDIKWKRDKENEEDNLTVGTILISDVGKKVQEVLILQEYKSF